MKPLHVFTQGFPILVVCGESERFYEEKGKWVLFPTAEDAAEAAEVLQAENKNAVGRLIQDGIVLTGGRVFYRGSKYPTEY